jgi:CCAAT-binding transcription factor (CBF-B/NF-YA) subunit B
MFVCFFTHTQRFCCWLLMCCVSVNPKQFHRILKRRKARSKIESYFQQRRQQEEAVALKPYLHESRHKHAMKRPRGPDGRFLRKEELAVYYAQHPEAAPESDVAANQEDGGGGLGTTKRTKKQK